jgi:hypothetical protein
MEGVGGVCRTWLDVKKARGEDPLAQAHCQIYECKPDAATLRMDLKEIPIGPGSG